MDPVRHHRRAGEEAQAGQGPAHRNGSGFGAVCFGPGQAEDAEGEDDDHGDGDTETDRGDLAESGPVDMPGADGDPVAFVKSNASAVTMTTATRNVMWSVPQGRQGPAHARRSEGERRAEHGGACCPVLCESFHLASSVPCAKLWT